MRCWFRILKNNWCVFVACFVIRVNIPIVCFVVWNNVAIACVQYIKLLFFKLRYVLGRYYGCYGLGCLILKVADLERFKNDLAHRTVRFFFDSLG